jgi:hypothetical protein
VPIEVDYIYLDLVFMRKALKDVRALADTELIAEPVAKLTRDTYRSKGDHSCKALALC